MNGSHEFLAQDWVAFRSAIKAVPTLDRLGCTRALIVASHSLATKTEKIDRIASALGDRCVRVVSCSMEHVTRKSVLDS